MTGIEADFNTFGSDVNRWMRTLRGLATAYREAFDRPLALTQELGELYACAVLDLERAPHGQAGYDAIDPNGRLVQIKSRAPQTSGTVVPRPAGRVGRFHHWGFEYALLVLLKADYVLWQIWRAEPGDLKEAHDELQNARHGIAISKYTKLGVRLYPSSTTE